MHAPTDIHGESGLDGTDLLPQPLTPAIRDVSAVDAMAKALKAEPAGTAWLVATGSMTNVAMLFAKHPELVGHIKGLSIMGGAIGGGFTTAVYGVVDNIARIGNWTQFAEFNIFVDPVRHPRSRWSFYTFFEYELTFRCTSGGSSSDLR